MFMGNRFDLTDHFFGLETMSEMLRTRTFVLHDYKIIVCVFTILVIGC